MTEGQADFSRPRVGLASDCYNRKGDERMGKVHGILQCQMGAIFRMGKNFQPLDFK